MLKDGVRTSPVRETPQLAGNKLFGHDDLGGIVHQPFRCLGNPDFPLAPSQLPRLSPVSLCAWQ